MKWMKNAKGRVKEIGRKASEQYKDAIYGARVWADEQRETRRPTLEKRADEARHLLVEKTQAVGVASSAVAAGARDRLTDLYAHVRYSKSELDRLAHDVGNQGARYRELLRNRTLSDSIFVGGETLTALLAARSVSPEIEAAYTAAYPGLSQEISFLDKVEMFDTEAELAGFLSGVKGKLFEQKYVDYLNSGHLPDGYVASPAGNTNQVGWDIQILGPHDEIARLLQLKASDSVAYVQEAMERYPYIDVVTTDEVYSHLVMAGIGDDLENGAISNLELSEQVDAAAESSYGDADLTPPLVALAFIAFTSYRNDSLTLYGKARQMGDRAGKTYLSYLLGVGVATMTQTWWLGPLAGATSRYFGDKGARKRQLAESLKTAHKNNRAIIERIQSSGRAGPVGG